MTQPRNANEERIEQQLIEFEDAQADSTDKTVSNLHGELETLANALGKPIPDDPHEAETACRKAVAQIQTLASEKTVLGRVEDQNPDATLPSGEMIGQYRIVERIGQGGMGSVYKAVHTKLEKTVALKILPDERLEKSDAVARFHREMKAVGKIEHPHLVRALDAGEADGSHYLVMEYVDGVDLSRLVKQYGKLPVATACELVRQAALGLEAAHQAGMVHRDVKPANLMLTRQEFGPPVVKVLDLGLARLADDTEIGDTELTTDNQIMGTLDFMAPEQAGNVRGVDTRADVYSLGATLFTLLTGRPPYQAGEKRSIIEKLQALANQPLPDVRQLRPDLPAGLADVVNKMLAKDREERFEDPKSASEALAPFAAEADLPALLHDANTMQLEAGISGSTASWGESQHTAEMPRAKPFRARQVALALAVLFLAPVLILYAGTIIRFATNQGELIVDVKDPSVEIKIVQNGVVVVDQTKDRAFTLKAIDGEIEVVEKDGGIKLTTKRFELTRGGKTTVTVTRREVAEARKPKPLLVAKTDSDRGRDKPAFANASPVSALAFDGKDDHVEIPNPAEWRNGPLTMEAWITAKQEGPALSAVMEIAGLKLRMFREGYQWMLVAYGPGEESKLIVDPAGLDQKLAQLETPIHLAGVTDGKSLSLFINGQLRASIPLPNDFTIRNRKEQGYIGMDAGKTAESRFAGLIDEVRISNVVRYEKNFTPAREFPSDDNTLALYRFHEGQGDVLHDSSGNEHHGKIVGATWLSSKPRDIERETAE